MKIFSLIIANLLLVGTIIFYLRNIVAKGVTPNPANFFIRSVVAVMNCFSYLMIVNKDYFRISVLIISTAGLLIIFFYALMRGRLTKLRAIDIACGIGALGIGVAWKTTGDPILANLLLQVIMLLAFYPAINGVLAGIAKEETLPWILATLCYIFMVISIMINWETGSGYALVHPVVSGIIGNGSLATAVWWQNKKINQSRVTT